ncbi:TetR/AcrR family transcriptional regulator [Ruficoccus sp. ZRK36]|uniref:TetR/AcrR family transcriptional regulator n=1 Tax=Ruficoccus sp. ZRK36 TaxID=2866311 RepID=UPI001C72C256|nr:TetR/AcrR family transcriptional regulator [Ruficoccus sp. ZRK36]QYY34323.1 TetR/AcrR family transcriptional regulator [Ruficoccus sp. ZRK36]
MEHKTKRDNILEVASKLFYEQGYHQTGIQQIIQQAGAAKGTFYSFFKSKEELGVAWLKARHHTWNKWLHDAVDTKRTPRTQILAAFDFLEQWMADCDYRGCAFLNTLAETPEPDSPLRKQILDHKQGLLDFFQSLVDKHQPDLPRAQREQTANTLFLLFEASIVHMQNFRAPWPAQTAKQQANNLL